jgi:hypothetical protein
MIEIARVLAANPVVREVAGKVAVLVAQEIIKRVHA